MSFDVNDGLADNLRSQVLGRLGGQLMCLVSEDGQRGVAPGTRRNEQNRRGG
ncbi:hypothetical protein ACFOY5_16955 [Massilia aurea]|uniref:hypothetical protein n=1 Tax=Massilia aurea TaxID=373040 RepID=UPI002161587D|nr:hypothetical protein [Massilia aurea]MCS0706448.1 hypothetical protein [Massilia aurea]